MLSIHCGPESRPKMRQHSGARPQQERAGHRGPAPQRDESEGGQRQGVQGQGRASAERRQHDGIGMHGLLRVRHSESSSISVDYPIVPLIQSSVKQRAEGCVESVV